METKIGKHTEGPWDFHPVYDGKEQLVKDPDGKRWLSRSRYISQGKKIICEVSMYKKIDEVDFGFPRVSEDEEFEGNCRVLRAAPELLSNLLTAMNLVIAYDKTGEW
jgi:hypothetical protein